MLRIDYHNEQNPSPVQQWILTCLIYHAWKLHKIEKSRSIKNVCTGKERTQSSSGISQHAFQTRLPECNIAQIYAPKSRAILIYMIIIVCFGFTCQLSSHLLDFLLKYIASKHVIFYSVVYNTFENN